MPSRNTEATKASRLKYALAHPEVGRAASLRFYDAHRDAQLVKSRQYRLANTSKIHARRRQRHREKTEARLAHERAHRFACRAHRAQIARAYQQAHPEVKRASEQRRRAARRHAPINDCTAAQWEHMQGGFQYRCAYCGKRPKKLTQDHLTPFIHGGSHTLHTIVPACFGCNREKWMGPVLGPVQPLLL